MAEIVKVAVVGGGSFGTVMANIAAGNGFPVSFWMRSGTLAAAINRDPGSMTGPRHGPA